MKVNVAYKNNFAALARSVAEKVGEITALCAENTAQRARELCPVDTGRLQASITAQSEGASARVSADTDYAAYVEFGTSRMAAQPYLVPALIGSAGEAASVAARVLGELFG